MNGVCVDSINEYFYTFDVCCDANSIDSLTHQRVSLILLFSRQFDTSKGIAYTIIFKLMEPCFVQRTYGSYGQIVLISPVI